MNDAIYQQAIKDLAQRALGSGRLLEPDRCARLDNPLCGDRIDIELKLGDDGRIAGLAHRTKGCLLCRASASILALHATGCGPAEMAAIRGALTELLVGDRPPPCEWTELGLFLPVRPHPSRHGCVLLPLRAVERAFHGRST